MYSTVADEFIFFRECNFCSNFLETGSSELPIKNLRSFSLSEGATLI